MIELIINEHSQDEHGYHMKCLEAYKDGKFVFALSTQKRLEDLEEILMKMYKEGYVDGGRFIIDLQKKTGGMTNEPATA